MFRKTSKRVHHYCGMPNFEQRLETVTEQHEDGTKSIYQAVKTVDLNDPSSNISFPDPKVYNDLESMIASGINPQYVNTVMLHDENINELNNIAESVLPNEEE